MEKYCEACGMPMNKKSDFALGDKTSIFCCFCVNQDGKIKSCEEIFEGGVQFFISMLGDDRKLAERVTRKNMHLQPYWKDKEFEILKGETATDEEFSQILRKLILSSIN